MGFIFAHWKTGYYSIIDGVARYAQGSFYAAKIVLPLEIENKPAFFPKIIAFIHAKLKIFIYLKQGRSANFRAVTLRRPNERILKTFSSIGGAAFIMLKIVK